MPKTTKRAATKRAARIAKAHVTELPKLEVKTVPPIKRSRGYKPPARGIARYPWATFLIVLIIGLSIYTLYYYKVGPFAPPKPQPKVVASCTTSQILNKITDVSPAPGPTVFDATKHSYQQAPAMSIDTNKLYCAGINTNRGLIVLELDPSLALNTVNNFVFLAQNHFYDGLTFHRVIQANQKTSASGPYIIQTGDPKGNGQGGPGYKFGDEPVKGSYTPGTVAMANSGANTNGSQFFICTGDDTTLPKSYNLFGHVVKGLDIAKQIQGPGDDPSTKNVKPDLMNHVIVVPAS